MKNLSIAKVGIYVLLSSLIIFCFSCGGDDQVAEEVEENTEKTLMSVEVNGEEFNGLANNETNFGFADANSTLISTVGDSIRYAWFQGSSSEFEISVLLSEDMWKTGTYPLKEGFWVSKRGAYVSYIVYGDFDTDYYDIEGEINITKCDLGTKEFEASFNFFNDHVTTTGTLNYELDHPDF